MAYTTPPTFSGGATLDAADLNILGDDIAYLKAISDGLTFSAVKVTRTASTNISTGVWTAITFTAEAFDYGSWWSSGTDIIVPSGAVPAGFTTIALDFGVRGTWAANSTGYRSMRVLNNGTPFIAPTMPGIAVDSTVIDYATFDAPFAAADVLTVEVYQNSGSTLAISGVTVKVARRAAVA